MKLRVGGLIEVEFVVQALALLHADRPAVLRPVTREAAFALERAGVLPEADAAALIEADRVWRAVQGMLRILLGRAVPARVEGAALAKVSRAAGMEGASEAALLARLDLLAGRVRGIFTRHIGEVA